jgi:glycosyltransferase involved in cell wall biosynthesis
VSAPLVSVVIPSYNYGRYIKTAVDSVLAQDYPNIEVVVSDNASKDETSRVLAAYANDARVRVHVNPRNIGLTPNINNGITLARGEFVTMLSADDFLLPGHTSRLVALAQAYPQTAFVYGNSYFAEETGVPHSVRNVYGQVAARYAEGRNEFAWLFMTCYMCLPTILFRKAVLERYGLFDATLDIASDWEICMRLAHGGEQFAYTPVPVAGVRQHAAQRSAAAYTHSGDELRESLEIGERYATTENAPRFRGFEKRMRMLVGDRLARLRETNPDLFVELEPRAQSFAHRLDELRSQRSPIREPKISVIVTSSGRIVSLRRALGSLQAQSYPNWEAIVVQDAGADVESFLRMLPLSNHIRFARTYDRLGPASARETGCMLISGDFVAFLDEDDEFDPTHLQSLLALTLDGKLAASSATRLVCDEYFHSTMYARPVAHSDEALPERPSSQDLEIAPCMPLGSVLFARELLDNTMVFRGRYGILAEWEMMLRTLAPSGWASSGERTFVEHVALGLSRQELAKRFASYPKALATVYEAHPSSSDGIAERRRAHEANLGNLFARDAASFLTPADLVGLYANLAGRSVVAVSV